MKSSIRVSIIVVNWNSGQLTKNAISPYINYESAELSCEVIVVDNASQDDSLFHLKNLPIKLICNDSNMGFGHACNQALDIADCNAKYILLLNPDTISDVSVLYGLIKILEANEKLAIAGPQQKYQNKKIIKSCGRFPTALLAMFEVIGISKTFPQIFTPAPIMTDFDHLSSRRVHHVMGSYMVIKRKAMTSNPFMDQAFFVYYEDLDFSRRIAKQGYDSFFSADYCITHIGGGSGDKAYGKRLLYSLISRRIYWKKHFSKISLLFLCFLSYTAEPILRIVQSPGACTKIIDAYLKYLKNALQKSVH